jgi:anhydro-N-acetylmuramic acid kinase
MIYRVIGVMSGSSLDGLDIAYIHFEEQSGKWQFEIMEAECRTYNEDWVKKLRHATDLNARDHALLDADLGHYIGQEVVAFMKEKQLDYRVALISSHGHTSFHIPPRVTVQLGQGSAIAAETGLPVVSDLRAVDVALGGQGAPIVPMGERMLWKDVPLFLNIGGIANISANMGAHYLAYDVCPANRVLNMLAAKVGKEYDEGGRLAASGTVNDKLLNELNGLDYYSKPFPKSLANDFGTDQVFPMLEKGGSELRDLLRTYVEHIALQVARAVEHHAHDLGNAPHMMVTGGGAFNDFLIERIRQLLEPMRVQVDLPDEKIIKFKEALIMGLLGVLRWRDEPTALASVTGARRDSVGGALWGRM